MARSVVSLGFINHTNKGVVPALANSDSHSSSKDRTARTDVAVRRINILASSCQSNAISEDTTPRRIMPILAPSSLTLISTLRTDIFAGTMLLDTSALASSTCGHAGVAFSPDGTKYC